jgi:hypothetical protein
VVKLGVAIMAHPKRSGLVADLVEALDRPVEVVWDRRHDRWDTGRRAWEAHDPDATHWLVLQDDALVCRDLIAGLTAAIEHVPDECIVSPYVGTRRPLADRVEAAVVEAGEVGAAWIVMQALNWGVGILAPTWTIPEMLEWCDTEPYPMYDRRVGRYYLRVLHWHTWCTWPSLIDHHGGGDDSLIGNGGGRHAHHWVGPDASAADIDWAGPVVRMPYDRRRAPLPKFSSPLISAWFHVQTGRRRLVRVGSTMDARLAADPVWSRSPIKEAAHA